MNHFQAIDGVNKISIENESIPLLSAFRSLHDECECRSTVMAISDHSTSIQVQLLSQSSADLIPRNANTHFNTTLIP